LAPILASAALLCATPALAQFSSTGSIYPALPAGQPSPWIVTVLETGSGAPGTLTINAGATVTSGEGHVGYSDTGQVTVTGAGATWTNSGRLYVGEGGAGTLNILDGGSVSNTLGGYIGDPSDGHVTVDGAGSTWNTGSLYLGYTGAGTLTITGGGQVSVLSGSNILIGTNATGQGTVTVSGAGSALQANLVYVGNVGQGALTIADGGVVSASVGNFYLGYLAGSLGTLNIGAPAGQPAAAPGSLSPGFVIVDNGAGAVVFNHTDSSGNYAFSQPISGNATLDVYAGVTALTGDNTYGGATTVHGGTLAVDGAAGALSPNSDTTVLADGVLALKSSADQTVASLSNAGQVTLQANSAAGTTLTVMGDYSGDGGVLALDVALGNSYSAADMLVVHGDALAGTTTLAIKNAGGLGAQTTDSGIPVVRVVGASNATFVLARPIVVGGFQYTLAKVGNYWCLQSVPVAPAAVPALSNAALALLALLLAGGAMARRRG